jgi:hypothetical protein
MRRTTRCVPTVVTGDPRTLCYHLEKRPAEAVLSEGRSSTFEFGGVAMTSIEFGPHHIVGAPEVAGTLIILGIALMAMLWMAYNTRWRPHG